jgi:hypothetical protein
MQAMSALSRHLFAKHPSLREYLIDDSGSGMQHCGEGPGDFFPEQLQNLRQAATVPDLLFS